MSDKLKRFQAAEELTRAGDALREVGRAGRPISEAEHNRFTRAEAAYVKASGKRG